MRHMFFKSGGGLALRSGAAAAALLLTAAAWQGFSADAASTAQGSGTVAAPASRAAAAGRDSYAGIVNMAAPAVVTIRTEGRARVSPVGSQAPADDFFRRFFGDPEDQLDGRGREPRTFRQRGLGSGVIVDADGAILTNNHVVEGADRIRVELSDGRTLPATLVGTDKASDLALLRIAASGLHPLALGNSDSVQVGDVVLAVGNPLGLGQTVTMGIVSAKGRSTGVGDGSYEDFLQTDAPINQGNSGGALVNMKGELVGINSQILSESGGNIGIGFAIPSNMAKHVMDQLRTAGRVARGRLGVAIQPLTSDMAERLGLEHVGGAIISAVTPGSAADRAGLKRGDIIEALGDQPVRDTNSLRNRVAEAAPGSTVDVTIVRDKSRRHVTVTLDEAT